MYEKIRQQEFELQKMSVQNEQKRIETDNKRFCLDIARMNGFTTAKELVSEASIIYEFLK